jgi:hypothetical protein
MYFAYKYAKKKYKKREQAKRDAAAENSELPAAEGIQQNTSTVTNNDGEVTTTTEPVTGISAKENASVPATETQDEPEEDPVEKKRRRRYRLKVLFGLLAPFGLQALDTTIIASALPYIAQDFSKLIDILIIGVMKDC